MGVATEHDSALRCDHNLNETPMEVVSGFHRVILISTTGVQNVRGVEIEGRVNGIPLADNVDTVSTLNLDRPNSIDNRIQRVLPSKPTVSVIDRSIATPIACSSETLSRNALVERGIEGNRSIDTASHAIKSEASLELNATVWDQGNPPPELTVIVSVA